MHVYTREFISALTQLDSENEYLPVREKATPAISGSCFPAPSPGIPPTRIMYNRISNILTNTFCQLSYSDTQTGLRLLSRRGIRNLRLRLDSFGYCSEMIVQVEKEDLQL